MKQLIECLRQRDARPPAPKPGTFGSPPLLENPDFRAFGGKDDRAFQDLRRMKNGQIMDGGRL